MYMLHSRLYRLYVVADGNFKLENQHVKKPEEDVWLRDGRGFMVMEGPYNTHIAESVETRMVRASPCNVFRGSFSFCCFAEVPLL